MFSQNHNLLMYLKAILTSHIEDNSDDEDADLNNDTDSSVSLSDKKKLKQVKSDFH